MCGLFGIINHYKRQLDKRAFITLGCANDARGGDACGIMIDRKVEKGTDKDDQYFQCWYPKSELLQSTNKCYVALGHCRKASVGGVAPEKAQPVTICDDDGNMLFCVIHNGTIYNYKELAEKYIPDVNIEGLTDSQVMARIFFYAGYDVLSEYNGGGAFIIQDYRTNKTLMFKGESKGSWNAVKTEVERPLYFVKTGKSVIFSSIYSILQGLYWGFVTYDVPSNVLLECNGLDIYKVKEYDRSNCYGCRVYTTTSSFHSKPYTNNSTTYGATKVGFDVEEGTYYNEATKELLHGIVHVSRYGYITKYTTCYTETFFFWKGIMLSGELAYNAVRDIFAEYGEKNPGIATALARRLSCNPVVINKKYYTFTSTNKKVPFSDWSSIPLTDIEMVCDAKGRVLYMYNTKEFDYFLPAALPKERVDKIVDYVIKSI